MANKITGADILNGYYNRVKNPSASKDEKDEKKKITAADILKGAETVRKYELTDTSGVNQTYIDTFFTDANNYLSSAEKDYGSVGWGNASSSYDSRNTTWQDLSTRADTIGAWLYKNKGSINGEYYTTLSSTLDDFRTSGSSALDAFKSARDYYAQWESEDAYNNWYAEQKRKEDEKNSILGAADLEQYFSKGNEYGKEPSFMDKLAGNTDYNSVAFMRNDSSALKAYEDNARSANGGSAGTVERQLLNQIEYKAAKWLKDDEFKIYNYYYAKDRENGTDTAKQYLASMEETLNKRAADERFATLDGNTLAEIFYGFAAGFDQFEQGIINLGNMVTGDTALTTPTQLTAGMVREDLADNGPTFLGSSLGQIGYDMISTTANMLPSILVGSVTGGLGGALTLGASATGNAYNEMRSLGYDEWQSRGYGLLVGASETVLSYALGGISKLGGKVSGNVVSKLVSKIDNALAKTAITLGGNMASEGLEEAIQTVLEPAFKALVTGEDFESPEWDEILYSGLLGALSAGIMEGAPTIAGKVSSDIQTAQMYSGKLDKTFDVDVGGKTSTIATNQTKAERQALQKELQRGLVSESLEINPESAYAKKMQGRLDKGKTLSGNQLNSLIDANESALVTQDKGKIKAATEARLTEYGETGDPSKIAEIITKKIVGEKISRAEQNILDGSNYAEVVMAELDPNNAEAKVYSSEWMKDIGTERINTEAYNRGVKADGTVAEAKATPTSEVAKETSFKTSEDGKTKLISADGETEVSIKEIASINNGEITLRLEDGSTVSAKDVELASDAEGLLYENVVEMGLNPATANAFIKGFNPGDGLSADVYAKGFQEAYRYGTYNIPTSAMSQKGFSADLTEAQRTLAYNLGKTDAKYKFAPKQAKTTSTDTVNAEKNASKTAKKGKLHNTLKPTNETQRASLKALRVVAEALGIDIYTFESEVNEKGERVGANGWYDKSDNSIHIDLHAGGTGKGTMLFTASHELTHFIRQWSPEKFKTFADFLFDKYGEKGVPVEELIAKKIPKVKKRYKGISEDAAYDIAYEEVVADACEAMLTDSNALEKIAELKAKDKTLWQKIKDFITKLVERITEAYKGLDPDSAEANYVRDMKEAAEQLQNLWTEALLDAGENFREDGIVEIDTASESVAPMLSERTWTESDYVIHRDAMAEKIAKALDVSIEKAKGYIDDINSIARMIANDRVRLDYEASSFGSAFVSNVEYGGSFDYTTLCKKRRIYTGTFTEIQKRLKDVALSPDDILKIRNLMIEEGIEATCGLCYVEGSRANMGKFAKEFIRLYKRDNPMAWIPNMADVNTPDGVEQMRINHPEAYEQYEYFWNHYGKLKDSDPALFASQQKPKLYEARKEYKGEILEHFSKDTSVAKKNLNGGIRMQSFSDFEIVHLIDTMQVIMDMSTVGLAGQAYTKVPEFAEAFGGTGLKINLSLIAKGVDADGKLIFDDREGMPHETAFNLRDKYSKDVGTIIVIFTDEQLLAAMADPRIDYIIPFHRSQWKKGQYGAMGLPKGTKDYTYMQNEKLIKKTYHEYRGRMVLDKATNYMPNEYWDFTKSGKENAENYLKMCAENNKRPKFYKLLDYDGNGTYSLKADGSTDGYWKLLIDFKMYDNEGVGSPQMAVTPTFNMDKAVEMLDEYKGGHSKYPVASSVVDKFIEQYEGADDVMYSDREVQPIEEAEYESLKKHFGVTANFRVAGYLLPDGKMLDFSGKHWGDTSSRSRQVDHRDVQEVLGRGNNGISDMIDMIGSGSIRLMPETGGINLAVYPNEKQRRVLSAYINYMLATEEQVIIDYDAVGGDTVHSREYGKYSSSRQILGDIRNYFNGARQSDLMSFHTMYSDRDTNNSVNGAVYNGKEFWIAVADLKGNIVKTWTHEEAQARGYDLDMDAIFNDKLKDGYRFFTTDLIEENGRIEFDDYGDRLPEEMIERINEQITIKNPLDATKNPYAKYGMSNEEGVYNALKFLANMYGDEEVTEEESTPGETVADMDYPFEEHFDENYTFDDWLSGNFSERDTDSMSTRSLLLGALRSAAQNSEEHTILTNYKHNLDKIYVAQTDLGKIMAKIDEITSNRSLSILGNTISVKEFKKRALAKAEKNGIYPGDVKFKFDRKSNKYRAYATGYGMILEADQLSRGAGGLFVSAEDAAKLKKLQDEASELTSQINTYDRELLKLEAMESIRDIVKREKKLAYERAKQKGREALKEYRESATKTQRELMERYQNSRKEGIERRKKTEMRHKIKKAVADLDKMLRAGKKDNNVKEEMKGAITQSLALAEILFSESISNEDIVRFGVDIVTESESKLLNEYSDLLYSMEALKDKREYVYGLEKAGSDTLAKIGSVEEKIAKIKNRIKKLDKELAGVFERERARLNRTTTDEIIGSLADEYLKLKNSETDYIRAAYDEDIHTRLETLKKSVKGTIAKDMNLAELTEVYDAYKMVKHFVATANKAFKAKKGEAIATLANRTLEEIEGLGKKRTYLTKAGEAISAFDWNNQKPVYAFERIGSGTFTELFRNVRAGEDTWATDMEDAQTFREEQQKKADYKKWDFKKKHTFTSSTGKEFSLTLGQIMSLYAYAKRGDQAKAHLRNGGFVFDGIVETEVTETSKDGKKTKTKKVQLKDSTAYNISEKTLTDIIGTLKKEQRDYVDAMQDYLSTTMGAKGNEVSMELYGVELFGEENYFPIKSAPQFLERAREQANGADPKIKNKGFTKETVPEAKNPIVLTPFMDVWAKHVNEMSMYHAFTLPLEDFYRVYNYKTQASETMDSMSVISSLENAHGAEAVAYIDQLLRDLNGGARSDARESLPKKLMSGFKKASVMASLSVVIQQPSAIVRAQALVDAKHFIGKKVTEAKHKELWAEVKKYAPVAIVKEMGYFDVGMGQSSVEWLKGEKTWKDKMDDILSYAPAKADEVTWVAIWNAVKRETLRKNPKLAPSSEAFLKIAGERFTEVITKTQVYDSTLSRSANMRSKSAFMGMLTAFMAEPTTSINMLQNAFRKGNRKSIPRVMGAVYGSVLLNSALVSLIYAMRDDDEDETFIEKYLARLTTEVIDGINPLTYIPFVKDIWSAAQGFDVERADMTLITSALDSLESLIKAVAKDTADMDKDELAKHRKSVTESIFGVTDTIANLTGVPVKNVRRDINGIINGIKTIITDASGRATTGTSLGDAILGDVKDSIPVVGWLPDDSKGDKLYDAIMKGDTAYIERLEKTYKSESALQSARRTALRENDPRIKEAAQAKYNGNLAEYMSIAKAIVAEGKFKQDDIVAAINSEISAIKKGETSEEAKPTETPDKAVSYFDVADYCSALLRGETSTAYDAKKNIIETEVANGKTKAAAEASFNSKFTSQMRDLYEKGEVTSSRAQAMLVSYGGKTEEEAQEKVQYWEFKKQYPNYDLTESAVTKYYNVAQPAGISVETYYDYSMKREGAKGTDLDGDGKTDSGSVKAEVMQIIHSLPITREQKTALYFANGWAASTIFEAPWY